MALRLNLSERFGRFSFRIHHNKDVFLKQNTPVIHSKKVYLNLIIVLLTITSSSFVVVALQATPFSIQNPGYEKNNIFLHPVTSHAIWPQQISGIDLFRIINSQVTLLSLTGIKI